MSNNRLETLSSYLLNYSDNYKFLNIFQNSFLSKFK